MLITKQKWVCALIMKHECQDRRKAKNNYKFAKYANNIVNKMARTTINNRMPPVLFLLGFMFLFEFPLPLYNIIYNIILFILIGNKLLYNDIITRNTVINRKSTILQ